MQAVESLSCIMVKYSDVATVREEQLCVLELEMGKLVRPKLLQEPK